MFRSQWNPEMGPGAKVSQHTASPGRGQAALQTQQPWGCKQLPSLAWSACWWAAGWSHSECGKVNLYPSAMPKFTYRDSDCAGPALCKSESILPSERQ